MTRGCVHRIPIWLPKRDDRSVFLIGTGATRVYAVDIVVVVAVVEAGA